jgi:hypothetical protein
MRRGHHAHSHMFTLEKIPLPYVAFQGSLMHRSLTIKSDFTANTILSPVTSVRVGDSIGDWCRRRSGRPAAPYTICLEVGANHTSRRRDSHSFICVYALTQEGALPRSLSLTVCSKCGPLLIGSGALVARVRELIGKGGRRAMCARAWLRLRVVHDRGDERIVGHARGEARRSFGTHS